MMGAVLVLPCTTADKTITVWKLMGGSGKRGAGKDLMADGPSIKQVLMVSKLVNARVFATAPVLTGTSAYTLLRPTCLNCETLNMHAGSQG
jgi:hypothetical protein